MNKILIKNGTIVNANGCRKTDIVIWGGNIVKVEPGLNILDFDGRVIDASGKLILPGGIDPHVHFALKTPAGFTSDNFKTGSMAAIAGGTTTIIDFVTPEADESLISALESRKLEALSCICDYSFHMSPIKWNRQTKKEMELCTKNEGISSFKTYMAYQSTIGSTADDLLKIMGYATDLGAIVTIHAEDDEKIEKLKSCFIKQGNVSPKYHALSRPPEVEANAVKIAIDMAKEKRAKIYFVHISSKDSLAWIKNAQKYGLQVFAETCPQYLLFDDSKLTDDFYLSAPFVFSPALHDARHKQALWKAIQADNIQTVGTDHCTFNLYGQKDLGFDNFTKIPNGAGGVEHRLELLYTFGVLQNKITLEKMVEIASTNPAKIFGIKNKGIIKEGYDADLVIWNTQLNKTISTKTQWQKCDANIYEGIEVRGAAELVMRRGIIVFENNQIIQNKGRFIYRD